MTASECYRRIALFQKADHIPNYEGGISPQTVRIWYDEGLPQGADPGEFFNMDRVELERSISCSPLPGVSGRYESIDQYRPLLEPLGYELGFDGEQAMVARKDGREYHINHDPWGSILLHLKHHGADDEYAASAFIHVQDALRSRAEWNIIRSDFQPDIAARYGVNAADNPWRERVQRWHGHDHVLVLEGPSMVGAIAQEMGFMNYCLQLYDDRAMIAEVMDARTDLALAILDKALDEVEFDMLWFWEDMAFRNGPIMSPEIFEEIATPRYKRLADWYRSRGGEIVAVDSDGDVRELIPGWLKGGINHIWPMEVFAGMDVVALRKEYGHAFSMRGGVDKFCIAKGKQAIDRELDRVFPVVQDGGYIPHADHMLPHASFEDYCYYMERKLKMLDSV
jgi:hypothetical protein